MGAPEPPPILIWIRINNPDAEDYTRLGMLINILDKDDDPDIGKYFVVDFGGGENPGSFAPSEIERIYAT